MKILDKADHILECILKHWLKILLACLLFAGTYDILKILIGESFPGHIWYLISFAFVIGAFILSIRPEYLNNEQEKILSKTAFRLIFSSILMLISHGFSLTEINVMYLQNVYLFITAFLLYFGFFIFYFSFAEFAIELFKIVWSKK